MELKNKKVLVTGAGGFIGSHLCSALLNKGASVTAMLHYDSRSDWSNLEYLDLSEKNSLNIIKGNIEDLSFMDNSIKNKDVVFHLAALIGIPYSYMAPISYLRTNIEGTLNVLECSKRHKIERIIHTSTSEAYGSALYTPIDEKHPLQGQSPYSATKISADKIAESYYCSFETPVTTVRPFNTYGPRQSARAIIPTIISQLINGNDLKLGDLSPKRDFTYVGDIVSGFILAAESKKSIGEVVSLGNGQNISVGDLAKKIISLMKSKSIILSEKDRLRPEKSEVVELICNNNKAKELLGWQPKISLEDGLTECIDFIKSNINMYKVGNYEK